MPVTLDQKPAKTGRTVGETLDLIRAELPEGRVIVNVQLNGETLDATNLALHRQTAIDAQNLAVETTPKAELARATIGKIAALIEWLHPRHAETAALFEKGQHTAGLEKLKELLSAWGQIQAAYSGLVTLMGLDLATLQVGERSANGVLSDFAGQLSEIQNALVNQDMVLLADVLQYEVDNIVTSWVALLEATLARVEH